MPPRPELIKDVETIKRTVLQLDEGDTPALDSKELKGAVDRITKAAQQDNPSCQETQDLTVINDRAQDGLMDADELHRASKIAVRVSAGTLGVSKGPRKTL